MQVFLHLAIKLHMYSNPWTSPYPLLCLSRRDAILKNYVEQRKPIKIFIFSSSLTMACEELSALGFTKKNKPLSLRIPFLDQILRDAQMTCYLQYLSISWVQIDFQTRRVLILCTLQTVQVFMLPISRVLKGSRSKTLLFTDKDSHEAVHY